MPAYLLVDNSNSFTKFALSTESAVVEVRKLATREVCAESVRSLVRDWSFDGAVVCSVVPQKGVVLREAFAPAPVVMVDAAADLGIGIDYPEPATIGADRLANAVAAARLHRTPAVVVDFGTALTFDIVSAEGNYLGGVIAPGLEAMTEFLPQRTALLPRIALLEPPGIIGKSTNDAMLAGAVYGYRGLVREILAKLREVLEKESPLTVVATGGYAELIAAGVPEIHEVRPLLTLDGLRLIANRYFAQNTPGH
jgi:type III pantothenate kinase